MKALSMRQRSFLVPLLTLSVIMAAPYGVSAQQAPGVGVNYETRLSGLEDEMRGLNGQLEQLQFSIRRMEQGLQRMQTDTDARLQRLETSANAAAQAQSQVQQQTQTPAPPLTVITTPTPSPGGAQGVVPDGPIDGTLGAVKIRDGRVTGGIVNPQAPALPTAPPDYGLTPQEQYDRAFGMLRQADYDGAEKAFKTFIDKNPKDKLIDNAKYWYGETIYVRGRFDESAVAFADAYQQNPQGAKAPDSLLKLSMSLAAIDKTQDACMTLTELKSKYPNASSSIRSRAEEQRSKLKCGKG